ncbi:ABC transporter permease [Gulosibacter sediminis]|uniref:ABC transporter permease n=1 Tax=Gulosibacter sediminis TaxID=1729695 RepID=UPI001868D295|nr:ABC transporter permease [Gulosibacter sediminis]
MSRGRRAAKRDNGSIPLDGPPAHVSRPLTRPERKVRDRLNRSAFAFDVEAAYGDLTHLTRVSVRPPLGEYIRGIWERRHFVWREARSRVATSNTKERLGNAWLIIRPVLDAIFYWLIFGVLLQMSRGMENYVAFVIVGIFMFQYTSSAFTTGSSAIRSSRSLIRAFNFPRASILVSMLLRDMLQRFPAMLVMFVMIMAIPPHAMPRITWLLFPVIFVLHELFNFGIYLLMARFGSALPDLSQAMSFLSRILMYGSAVIFPIDRFINHPTILTIVEANPIYQFLMAYRTTMIDGVVPTPEIWLMLIIWAVATPVIGFVLFWFAEESYAREQ